MSIEEIRDLQKKTQEVLNQMIDVVPQDHILYPILLDNKSSLDYSAPEMVIFWIDEIAENLKENLSFPLNDEWMIKVYEIWTGNKYDRK